jgi:hypothetical protein
VEKSLASAPPLPAQDAPTIPNSEGYANRRNSHTDVGGPGFRDWFEIEL